MCNIALRNRNAAELAAFMVGKAVGSTNNMEEGAPADSPVGPMNPQDCEPFNLSGLGNANQAAKDWILGERDKWIVRELYQGFAELLFTTPSLASAVVAAPGTCGNGSAN
ncbi:MAG: hypothetical protein LBE21_05145 [Pseudomonadales bacterium]|nr:hypothetical protein [Pseudomonadales bacterium]